MNKMSTCILMAALLMSCCMGQAEKSGEVHQEEKSAVVRVEILQEQGGRVSWSHELNVIAFDRMGDDGYNDIYVMNVDGTQAECLTCGKAVPQLHNGNPSWHPSGEYIVFQAQDPDLRDLPVPSEIMKYIASPGMGIHNNVWVMRSDGSKFWQVTHVKEYHGALHPHFSPDGNTLVWSEIISPYLDRIGKWAIKIADFRVENGDIHVDNIQTLQPGNLQLYEMHGVSPDGTKILFSGVEEGGYYYDMEIYIMDAATGHTEQLTDNNEWDEHAHFTVDGNNIVWVSSEGIPQPKGDSLEDIIADPPKLEYWIMNVDGSNKRRLSGFNYPGTPEYMDLPGGVGLGDFDWGPDGKTIVAKIRHGKKGEITALIEFDLQIQVQPSKTSIFLTHIPKMWVGYLYRNLLMPLFHT